MTLKNGEFVLLNYTLKVKESGEVIDTTIESVAKEAGVKHTHEGSEPHRYEAYFVVVGEGWVPKGLDEALVGLEAGKQTVIEVPPEKGHGARDPSKIRMVPMRRFRSEGLTPTPGTQVNLDGKLALVRTVGAGRVQVDYNHPLAGRTLVYDLTVDKVLEKNEDKILQLIRRRIGGVDPQKFQLQMKDKELVVEVPEEAFYLDGIQIAKKSVATDIEKFFPEFERVAFVEYLRKPAPPAAPEAKVEEAKAAAPAAK